jgi:hypothetical protein
MGCITDDRYVAAVELLGYPLVHLVDLTRKDLGQRVCSDECLQAAVDEIV